MRPKRAIVTLTAVLLGFAVTGLADDPPLVEHQPVPCTVPDQPLTLCATVTDDSSVAKVRIYFRRAGEDFFSFVEMVFGGLNYCGTLPAPREGALKAIEYYVQAVDDQYQAQRTSTFQMTVQTEGLCGFAPVEKDPARASSITVYATHRKQGKKLDNAFSSTGVRFVPVVANK
jgi:hypothetical protein